MAFYIKEIITDEVYEKTVKLAIIDVISNKYNVSQSARKHGVSWSILHNRIEKFKKSFTYSELSSDDQKCVLPSKYTSNTIFTSARERKLAEYINTYSILQEGYTYIMAQKFIFEYGNLHNIKMPDLWFRNKATGDVWVQSFMKRNAEYLRNLFKRSASYLINNMGDSGINTLPKMKALTTTALKPRNIITLEERVQIINEYESNPCIPSIADLFECSWFQVIIIIHDKEETMTRYAEQNATEDDERRQKISFMEDVLYEYILRATYHNVKLCDIIVKKKMCEIRNCTGISFCCPTLLWMQQFMKKYKITEWNLDKLKELLVPAEKKENCFEIQKIVNYVRCIQIRNQVIKQKNEKIVNDDMKNLSKAELFEVKEEEMEIVSDADHFLHEKDIEHSSISKRSHRGHEDIDIKPDITELQQAMQTDNNIQVPPIKIQYIERLSGDIRSQHQSDTGVKLNIEITSNAHALKLLKPLENFALLEENYRAIGLITKLRDIFRNRQKV